MTLFGKTYEKEIGPKDKSVDFVLDLDPGKTMLETNFIEGSEAYGVYYTYIELLN
ncbi:hypothetical protein [Arenibacter sp. F20364]|uniref:hypothetical protein n=1 Tax=Arenibacter sp. F20364 TaxID=2926415 RepID=UPI001FF2D46D|nr:hypothetical protein [Arenibacter sp. F20364]MCK0188931.1 hypothetical protein [Arenibacter sp. F20364]